MALPLSGIITSAMILTELGFTGSGNVLRNVIQKPGGNLQVLVNSTWVNLNMCSPYLPSEVPAYIVATDWYGYNHGVSGVETLTIAGDTTLDVGQVVTYTASMTGDNLTGVVLTWYKFEIDSWNTLNTGTTTTITWADPRNAIVKVVATNICNRNIVETELPVSYNCTTITGDPYVGGTFAVNQPFDVWAVNANGVVGTPSNTRLGITFFWEVTGSVQIVSGQGTNKVVLKPTSVSSNLNVRVTIGSCGGTSTSVYINFSSANPVSYYYNNAQSRSIQKNDCGGGQVGSYVTVTRDANTHVSTNNQQEANDAAIAWLYTQDAQNVANSGGTCGNTASYPNDRRTQNFTRNTCGSQYGTVVEYVVPAGTYYAPSVGEANTLAQNDINSNGQNYANSAGQCVPAPCTDVPYSLSISVTTGSGYFDASISVGLWGGSYSVKQEFNGQILNSTISGSGYNSYNLPRFNTSAATGVVKVTVSSYCSPGVEITSNNLTVTGVIQCTGGLIEIGALRAFYSGGSFTVGMNMNNYANVRDVGGSLEYRSGGSVLHTFYFSGLDFSGGNTVYQTFTIPSGAHYVGYLKAIITTASNLCNVPQEYNNFSSLEVINPY